MFVKWHTRTSVEGGYDRVRAILVEAKRVRGKPHQRHVGFLGSFIQGEQGDVAERYQFWNSARQVLDRLVNQISPEQRTSFEKALAERIRPLTPAQVEAHEKRKQERAQEMREYVKKTQPMIDAYRKSRGLPQGPPLEPPKRSRQGRPGQFRSLRRTP